MKLEVEQRSEEPREQMAPCTTKKTSREVIQKLYRERGDEKAWEGRGGGEMNGERGSPDLTALAFLLWLYDLFRAI